MSERRVAVVIEDDLDVRNLVDAVLRQAGFEVHCAPTGAEGVAEVRRLGATVVTLDIGLPDIDGYEVLRRIRQFNDCYVIMLTGRAEELDLLMGLGSGADDYLTKPFRPRELRARISAMLRRPRAGATGVRDPEGTTTPAPGAPAQVTSVPVTPAPGQQAPATQTPRPNRPIFEHNGLVVDPATRRAVLSGIELTLTRSEFDLIHDLMRSAGAVRTRADLVRVVRGEHYSRETYVSEADERAVEVHVGNLRRKLRDDSRQPRWLQTVRGVGYRLAPPRP